MAMFIHIDCGDSFQSKDEITGTGAQYHAKAQPSIVGHED